MTRPRIKEPKAKNIYGIPPGAWRRMKPDERVYCNKVGGYMQYNREQFTDVKMTVEQWQEFVSRVSLYAADVFRRSKQFTERNF